MPETPHHDPTPGDNDADLDEVSGDPTDDVLTFDTVTDTPTRLVLAVTHDTITTQRPGQAPSQLGHELAELVRDVAAYTGRRVVGRARIASDTATDTLQVAADLEPADLNTTGGHDHVG